MVAIATHGIKQDKEAKRLFDKGYTEMKKRIKPSLILCYGECEIPKECIKIKTFVERKWRK